MTPRHDRTIAERIADMYDNDGQMMWRGRKHLHDVCDRFCTYSRALRRRMIGNAVASCTIRWDFPDGSAIVGCDGCWDLGFDRQGCGCMMGAGHDDECETLATP